MAKHAPTTATPNTSDMTERDLVHCRKYLPIRLGLGGLALVYPMTDMGQSRTIVRKG